MIQQLIDAGKFDEAETLIQTQLVKRKLSGHDAQELQRQVEHTREATKQPVRAKPIAEKPRQGRKGKGHK